MTFRSIRMSGYTLPTCMDFKQNHGHILSQKLLSSNSKAHYQSSAVFTAEDFRWRKRRKQNGGGGYAKTAGEFFRYLVSACQLYALKTPYPKQSKSKESFLEPQTPHILNLQSFITQYAVSVHYPHTFNLAGNLVDVSNSTYWGQC